MDELLMSGYKSDKAIEYYEYVSMRLLKFFN
jgi:hypothetical protein